MIDDENEEEKNEEKKTDNKDIEIVNGDGSDIDFSPVYEHLNALKPKTKDENKKKQEIIIPKVQKKEWYLCIT